MPPARTQGKGAGGKSPRPSWRTRKPYAAARQLQRRPKPIFLDGDSDEADDMWADESDNEAQDRTPAGVAEDRSKAARGGTALSSSLPRTPVPALDRNLSDFVVPDSYISFQSSPPQASSEGPSLRSSPPSKRSASTERARVRRVILDSEDDVHGAEAMPGRRSTLDAPQQDEHLVWNGKEVLSASSMQYRMTSQPEFWPDLAVLDGDLWLRDFSKQSQLQSSRLGVNRRKNSPQDSRPGSCQPKGQAFTSSAGQPVLAAVSPVSSTMFAEATSSQASGVSVKLLASSEVRRGDESGSSDDYSSLDLGVEDWRTLDLDNPTA